MKTFVKSEKNHLITFALGQEDLNGFTGIIIHNNTIFYIDKNNIYKGTSPKDDLINRDEIWEVIFANYEKFVYFDFNAFAFDKIEKNEVYVSVLENKYLFFSNKNTEQTFSIDLLSLIKLYIPNEKVLYNDLVTDISLHLSLIRLEKLAITISNLKSAKLTQRFNKLLSGYGFSLKS